MPENEIAREARRVFRKLADPKARLTRVNERNWAVVQRGVADSGRTKVAAKIVKQFRQSGWLEADGDTLALSEGGRRWLASALADIDAFGAQHQLLGLRVMRDQHGEETVVAVNDAESPLSWLKARGSIDEIQFQAGERLRRDYTLAHLEPRLCTDLSAPVVLGSRAPGAASISDTALAAKQRFAKAMTAVGAGLSDLLFDICCALQGLETAENGRKWPRRSGKVVLSLALDRLADHYGLRTKPARGRMRAWSADVEAASA